MPRSAESMIASLRSMQSWNRRKRDNLRHFLNQVRSRHPFDLPAPAVPPGQQLPGLHLRKLPGVPGNVRLPLPYQRPPVVN